MGACLHLVQRRRRLLGSDAAVQPLEDQVELPLLRLIARSIA
jgi:hypothetical protein